MIPKLSFTTPLTNKTNPIICFSGENRMGTEVELSVKFRNKPELLSPCVQIETLNSNNAGWFLATVRQHVGAFLIN